ncbi:hypothetical protein CCHR01_14907 [Colletotrichum chrysophilum]|uniref:Uncharacterized protein n=1 Tax=Colletotrichum chrysophilum TaxID=1836956 RepID=A0AAD9A6N0_9PEZI|nr:hypothetical protein CCHR01_14907 [Colletotrichum chrysophilum]
MVLLGSCQLPFPFPKQRPGRHRPITIIGGFPTFCMALAQSFSVKAWQRSGSLPLPSSEPMRPCSLPQLLAPIRNCYRAIRHPELNLRFNSLPLSAMMSRNIRAADPPSRIDIIVVLILTHGVSSLQSNSPRMSRHQIHCSTVPAGIRSLATT